MRRLYLLPFLLVAASINFFCSKNKGNSNSSNSPEDIVVGSYFASNTPPPYVAGSATISKTGTGKYQFTPGSASMPSFSFQYDAIASFFTGSDFAYLIPKQNSNSVLLDSAYMTLYTNGAKSLSLTLTSRATGNSWAYNGIKQ